MTNPLPTIRRATVTRVTTLECAVCTNRMHLDGFPVWTLPRTLWCPWCGAEQIYPVEKSIAYQEKEVDIPVDIINGSSLTTERERAYFKARVQTFLDLHLQTAPREQLEAIEREMLHYRPTADHRK
jgi:hypothetical protein